MQINRWLHFIKLSLGNFPSWRFVHKENGPEKCPFITKEVNCICCPMVVCKMFFAPNSPYSGKVVQIKRRKGAIAKHFTFQSNSKNIFIECCSERWAKTWTAMSKFNVKLRLWSRFLKTIAQKMKFPIKDFFSKCNRRKRRKRRKSAEKCRFGHIYTFTKSLMENFIFCVVKIIVVN